MRVCLCLLLALVCLTGCAPEESRSQAEASGPPPTMVTVASTRAGRLTEELKLTGHLRALQKAEVTSRLTGRVARVAVREGDYVSQGEPLIWLDADVVKAQLQQAEAGLNQAQASVAQTRTSAELTGTEVDVAVQTVRQNLYQAQANTARAEAELADAQVSVRRQRELFKGNAVPKTQLEQAELRMRVAEKNLVAARAGERAAQQALRQAEAGRAQTRIRQAEVRSAQAGAARAAATVDAVSVDLSDTVIRAPVSGVVTFRDVEAGQTVSSARGGTLLRIVDNKELDFVATVDERFAPALEEGQTVAITSALVPGREYAGRIAGLIPSADVATHTVRVRVVVRDPEGKLLDGVYIEGMLKLKEHEGVIIPRDALQIRRDETYVMVREGDTASKQPVKVAFKTETEAVVAGLQPGAQVIIAGASGLTDGRSIRVQGEEPSTQ